MRNFLIAAVCFVATAFALCAASIDKVFVNDDNTPIVTRSYNNLPSFDQLYAYSGFDVKYTVGGTPGVTVEVSEKALKYIVVKVVDGRLEIGIDRSEMGHKLNNVKVKATVTGPALKGMLATSGADIDVITPMTVKGDLSVEATSGADISLESVTAVNVRVNANSGADVDIEGLKTTTLSVNSTSGADADIVGITAKNVSANVDSGADIKLKGTAGSVNFTATSAGTLKASGLKASKGSAQASGSGDIYCNVGALTQSSSNSGSIYNR